MVGPVPVYRISWPSVFQVVLTNPLGRQLRHDVVQVVGVGVAVARQVGAKFCLVVDLVPHHRVRLARGAGRANGKNEASVPGHDQQLQNLETHERVKPLIYSSHRNLKVFYYFTSKRRGERVEQFPL